MAVCAAIFAFVEFVEFCLYGLWLLIVLIFSKPAQLIEAKLVKVEEVQKRKLYTYKVTVEINQEQKESTLVENLKADKTPMCLGPKPMPIRYSGEKCRFMKPVEKHVLRSFVLMVAAIAVTLVCFFIGGRMKG